MALIVNEANIVGLVSLFLIGMIGSVFMEVLDRKTGDKR